MIFKTFTQLVADLIAAIGAAARVTNFNVGSVARTLVDAIAGVVAELYSYASSALLQAFWDTATGWWLARIAETRGLTRTEAIAAAGNVTFSRAVARATNVVIPAGTIVGTLPDSSGTAYRYATTAEAVLLSGTTSITAPVAAIVAGSAGNVGSSSITVLHTYVAGIDAVTNTADWLTTAGADEESDTALRARYLAAWSELSRVGLPEYWRSLALGVTGVAAAVVDDNQPRGEGTVDVYITTAEGLPSPALLALVQAVFDQEPPVIGDVLARAPEALTVPVTLVVTPLRGYATAAIDTDIRTRLSIYFGDVTDTVGIGFTPLALGRDVVQSRLVSLCQAVSGVYAVRLTAPADDLVVEPNQYPELGTVSITFLAATEEE